MTRADSRRNEPGKIDGASLEALLFIHYVVVDGVVDEAYEAIIGGVKAALPAGIYGLEVGNEQRFATQLVENSAGGCALAAKEAAPEAGERRKAGMHIGLTSDWTTRRVCDVEGSEEDSA